MAGGPSISLVDDGVRRLTLRSFMAAEGSIEDQCPCDFRITAAKTAAKTAAEQPVPVQFSCKVLGLERIDVREIGRCSTTTDEPRGSKTKNTLGNKTCA